MGYANSTFLDADDVYAILKKDIKDINNEIEDLSKLTKWLGVTTTPITENSTVNPIMISGISVTAKSGDITKYGNDNFKFTDVGTWQYYYDKTDVYTKDETDELLDEKMPNTGNTKPGSFNMRRSIVNITGEVGVNVSGGNVSIQSVDENDPANSSVSISAGNATGAPAIYIEGDGSIDVCAGYASTDEVGAELVPNDGKLSAPEGKSWHLLKGNESKSANTEVARKGDLTAKLDKTGGTVTGAVKTTKSTFTDNDEFVPKSYVDTHGITDYTQLTNKPSINNVTLTGNKTLSDLGLSDNDNYTKTLLWENPSGMTVVSPITLTDDYTNYDLVAFEVAINNLNNVQEVVFSSAQMSKTCCLSFHDQTMGVYAASNTVLNATTWDGGNTYVIQKIYGINLGARKPYKETRLYTNSDGQRHDSITLVDEVTNYDVIAIDFVYSNGEINSQKLIDVRANAILAAGTNNILNINFDIAGQINAQIYVSNSAPLIMGFAGASGYRINDVIGISYGGSVKGRNVTSLFTNSGNTNPASITLPTAYTEFDEIIVAGYEGNISTLVENFILSDTLKTNDYISLQSGDTYLNYLVASTTSFTFANASGLVISGIYGIKYDSDYITIDSEMSSTSENPVQNKVIKEYVDNLGLSIVNGQLCQTYNL